MTFKPVQIFKQPVFILSIISSALLTSCGFYSFTGISVSPEVKTFQVNWFQNQAAIVEPGLDRDFTLALQDEILNQTSLDLVNAGGDIVYEGEITRYFIAPMTSQAGNVAAENRVTVDFRVRYFNRTDESKDFERTFSFYFDYPNNQQLVGGLLEEAKNIIFERVIQDIINASLAEW